MKFDLAKSIEILERTPFIIENILKGISVEWTNKNEGHGTWSVYDIVGHMVHGEKTDWITRTEIILSDNANKKFFPFDRFAHFKDNKGKSLQMLISDFKTLRKKNLSKLRLKKLKVTDFTKSGIHPDFGKVTLKQLLSAWVVHDLNHIAQIARVISKQYKKEVGPWSEYLPILNS